MADLKDLKAVVSKQNKTEPKSKRNLWDDLMNPMWSFPKFDYGTHIIVGSGMPIEIKHKPKWKMKP